MGLAFWSLRRVGSVPKMTLVKVEPEAAVGEKLDHLVDLLDVLLHGAIRVYIDVVYERRGKFSHTLQDLLNNTLKKL